MLCRDHCHYCTFAKPPARARRAVPDAGGGGRRSRAPARARACKEALFTLGDRPEERYAGGARVARPARIRVDARLRARHRHQRDRGDRAAAAPEPGRDVLRGARAAEARERVDGADAGDVARPAVGEGRPALRVAGQACRRCGCERSRMPAGSRSRSRPASSSGSARRTRARGLAVRDPRPPPSLPPHPRSDRPELPREAGNGDGRRARAGRRGVPRRGRDDTGRDGAARERAGAAEPLRRGAAAATARRGDQRLGRRVAAHARSREPRAAVAGDRVARGDDRRARQDPARATRRSIRGSRAAPIPGSAGKMRAPVAALLGDDGLAVDGAMPDPIELAGSRCHLEAPDDRAHVRQGGRGRPSRADADRRVRGDPRGETR